MRNRKYVIPANISYTEWDRLVDDWIFDELKRAVIKYKLYNGASYEQVAEKFELSVTTVKDYVKEGVTTITRAVRRPAP